MLVPPDKFILFFLGYYLKGTCGYVVMHFKIFDHGSSLSNSSPIQPNNNMQPIMLKCLYPRMLHRGEMSWMLHLHLDYLLTSEPARALPHSVSSTMGLLIGLLMFSVLTYMKSLVRMWHLIAYKLHASRHIWDSKKIFHHSLSQSQ